MRAFKGKLNHDIDATYYNKYNMKLRKKQREKKLLISKQNVPSFNTKKYFLYEDFFYRKITNFFCAHQD